MGLFRLKYAETGSARWWQRLLTDVGLRLAALVFLILELSTHHYSSGMFWFGVAAAILIALVLIPRVAVVFLAAIGRLPREDKGTPGAFVEDPEASI